MKRLLVIFSAVVLGGVASSASVSAHPGSNCHLQDHCRTHCTQFHRGVDTAVCLATHNFPN